MQIPPLAPPPADQLLHRISVARCVPTPGGPGSLRIDSSTIVLRALNGREPAGFARSTWHRTPSSGAGGGTVRAYRSSAPERAAAQAVTDALLASGLLSATWHRYDGRVQEPGTVRIWLGTMQRYLQAPAAAVPPAMRSVLDAVESWQRVATAPA